MLETSLGRFSPATIKPRLIACQDDPRSSKKERGPAKYYGTVTIRIFLRRHPTTAEHIYDQLYISSDKLTTCIRRLQRPSTNQTLNENHQPFRGNVQSQVPRYPTALLGIAATSFCIRSWTIDQDLVNENSERITFDDQYEDVFHKSNRKMREKRNSCNNIQ